MSVVAIYNMKGGVGKTTAAVNLAHLASAAGQRALLWDLDPQAASTYAFRIRPRVTGFGKRSLESGHALGEAIKETDYSNLDLLPADFGYRKLDRLLGHLGKPERVVKALLDTLGRDYDVVFLDCPAGFSLLIEGILAAVDAVLVPTIPTVLSLRTVARLVKWADGSDSTSELAAFLSMVDRRKALHRRACEWSRVHPDVFLTDQIPYASVVEQMAVRRMPLGEFAPRDSATSAFAGIWAELQTRLQHREKGSPRPRDRRALLRSIESLIARLESADRHEHVVPAVDTGDNGWARGRRNAEGSHSLPAKNGPSPGPALEGDSQKGGEVDFVHSFDTDRGDLHRCGYLLELRERSGSLMVIAARSGTDDNEADNNRRVQAQIDGAWARDILSGVMSPLVALEQRLGRPVPWLVESVRATVGGRSLRRVDSRTAEHAATEGRERPRADITSVLSSMIRRG